MNLNHTSFPVASQLEMTVSVSLGKIPHFTEYLISENIPFFLKIPPLIEKTNEDLLDIKVCLIENKTNDNNLSKVKSDKEILKKIYEDYLLNGIDKIPPNEKIIAKRYNVKLATFRGYFKENFGKTFYQLYIERKMHYAAQLLEKGFRCVEVSRMIGYSLNSDIKFNKMFQKYFGTTPRKYQLSALL